MNTMAPAGVRRIKRHGWRVALFALFSQVTQAAYSCPAGFSSLTSSSNGAYCYAAFNNNNAGLSWGSAETACVNTGAKLAHLASIRDASQQAAVVSGRCGGSIPAGHAYWVRSRSCS